MTLKPPSLTIGIEEEYQIIDPVTRELKSYITEILKEDVVLLGEVKPELHQSMVEVGTKVCRTPAEARASDPSPPGDGTRSRNGLSIVAAGITCFVADQEITLLERYIGVREDCGVAQRLLISAPTCTSASRTANS
jgi:carboxylate-amine ligase